MSMSVCLSFICPTAGITRKPLGQTLPIFVRVAYGRGSVLVRWRCTALCTSGFVDDVRFSYNGLGGVTLPQLQPRCNVMHRLTPLLCGICCVLFCPRLERALRLEEPFVKGLPGRMQCIIALLSLLTAVASSMLRRQGD